MENRTLEITLQYAKDLNKVNLITKMDVYAVVSISGGKNKSNQKTKTPVDHDGDANPNWNFPMKFTIDEAALQQNRLTLDIKLVCERALGDKDVGEVNVPIKELLDSPAKGSAADGKQFVSYQVRKPGGQPKGQLNFSYKFGNKSTGATASPPYDAAFPVAAQSPPIAYPAGPSSVYPPPVPGGYPPPAPYQVAAEGGGGHYPPPDAYPPAPSYGGYPPPPVHEYGYPPPPSGYGYPPPPPPSRYGFPPQQGYGYPPPQGHGYPPPPGYGYPPPPAVQKPPKKNNKFGSMGLGAGLLGGAIGGLLVGDVISDAVDFDCGGFDF
ncbi:hypothetical protein ACJIZ3_014139 [Penstemon smallii]|uniref:C2 domain-containing protein n=1 Tax=Penstemon smallii TaxID=265156 RepID=A0ABD3RM02_9LAMI